MDHIERTLRRECNLCDACIRLYVGVDETTERDNQDIGSCTLCLGLLSKNEYHQPLLWGQIMVKLREKMSPYADAGADVETNAAAKNPSSIYYTKNKCGSDAAIMSNRPNFISKDSPTIVLPNMIIVIAHCINCAIDELIHREEELIHEEMDKLSSESNDDDHHLRRKKLQRKEQQLLNYKHRRSENRIKNKPIDIYNQIKELVRHKVRKLIKQINNEYNKASLLLYQQNESAQLSMNTPRDKEEGGYLKFHLVFTLPLLSPYIPFASKTSKSGGTYVGSGRLSLPKLITKRQRKRFRGNDPVAKQGGDPRTNLNSFVNAKLISIQTKLQSDNIHGQSNTCSATEKDGVEIKKENTIDKKSQVMEKNAIVEYNIHCSLIERNSLVKHLETLENRDGTKRELSQWMLGINNNISFCQQQRKDTGDSNVKCGREVDNDMNNNIGIFVSCWRNHFYLKGKYTKSRRDVSQTPFFVVDDQNSSPEKICGDETQDMNGVEKGQQQEHKRMKRLGISSVEEEICPIISNLGCNGISEANNETTISNNNESRKNCSNLVYGMCKFHASGREDMDVRMILPLEAMDEPRGDEKKLVGSGRPFVCEVIDAHKMPTNEDLENVVRKINQIDNDNNGDNIESSVLKEMTLSGEGEWVNEGTRKHVQYGSNPNGVGISSLSYCQSSSFSNLQSETEDKVKFYGCLCWSKAQIPSQAYLEEKLIKGDSEGSIYPLQIEQSTPLRVLHRRSASSRTRHVLSMRAKRIDDHWFRLHLSTSAGTYVKEFCHGDCGRTKPSVSSLLGCKIDIVELDCEGIAV